jgi:hypothetical protein
MLLLIPLFKSVFRFPLASKVYSVVELLAPMTSSTSSCEITNLQMRDNEVTRVR